MVIGVRGKPQGRRLFLVVSTGFELVTTSTNLGRRAYVTCRFWGYRCQPDSNSDQPKFLLRARFRTSRTALSPCDRSGHPPRQPKAIASLARASGSFPI